MMDTVVLVLIIVVVDGGWAGGGSAKVIALAMAIVEIFRWVEVDGLEDVGTKGVDIVGGEEVAVLLMAEGYSGQLRVVICRTPLDKQQQGIEGWKERVQDEKNESPSGLRVGEQWQSMMRKRSRDKSCEGVGGGLAQGKGWDVAAKKYGTKRQNDGKTATGTKVATALGSRLLSFVDQGEGRDR
jgi:hypothetical protein